MGTRGTRHIYLNLNLYKAEMGQDGEKSAPFQIYHIFDLPDDLLKFFHSPPSPSPHPFIPSLIIQFNSIPFTSNQFSSSSSSERASVRVLPARTSGPEKAKPPSPRLRSSRLFLFILQIPQIVPILFSTSPLDTQQPSRVSSPTIQSDFYPPPNGAGAERGRGGGGATYLVVSAKRQNGNNHQSMIISSGRFFSAGWLRSSSSLIEGWMIDGVCLADQGGSSSSRRS